jgi:hypothetical protein
MVKRARDQEDAVLADPSRVVRWAGPAFVLFSVVLIPWTIYLGLSLPARQLSPHYNIAWVGFDVLLLITLGATGYFALRHSRYLAVTAAAAAALLVVDAWFDIMTSPRSQILQAVVLAVLVELPLAAVCTWLSYHTEHLAGRRSIPLSPRDLALLCRGRWPDRPSGGGPGRDPHQQFPRPHADR